MNIGHDALPADSITYTMAIISTDAKFSRSSSDAFIGPGGRWNSTAPRRVREGYQAQEAERGWAAWRKHLAKRKLSPLYALLPGKTSPLLWVLPAGVDLDQTVQLIELLHEAARQERSESGALENEVACWLAQVESAPASVGLGLECLAWCAALPHLAADLPERLWWIVLNRIVSVADEAASTADPVTGQLLSGELPLALAYSFPELEACQALAERGRRAISEAIAEILDGEGLPHARHLPHLRPLLASWTRSFALGQELSEGWCSEAAHNQYPGLVQHAVWLSRAGGQQVFAKPDSAAWDPSLLKAALRFADDCGTERVLKAREKGTVRATKYGDKKLPAPAFEGEWAALAVLRTDWSRSAPQLSVAYGDQHCATELSLGDRCLWSGNWEVEVRFNDKQLAPQANWEQLCWVSDADVDYLELELQLSDEVTVQRHILLAREGRFLLLADAVLGIQQGTIEYRGMLPIEGHSTFQPEHETREGNLVISRRPIARVLPLALPEWRSGGSRGSLQASQRGLELVQSADAEALLAPLFIDLDPKRIRKEATWRQLTVAQNRVIQPPDVAVGYRAQVGKLHWLVYRSLATTDIRTVLGQNLMNEFLVAQFQDEGSLKTLLEIE